MTSRRPGRRCSRSTDVTKAYGAYQALDGVSFALHRGETLAIVGERLRQIDAGPGAAAARHAERRARPCGRGRDLFTMPPKELFGLRRQMQMVFQDPTQSLNPRMTVHDLIAEAWAIHPGSCRRPDGASGWRNCWRRSGCPPTAPGAIRTSSPAASAQRIAIARALALEPELIVCDEAVSALDVSVQAQVIALLDRLRRELGIAFIFIAHDLPVVRDFADRVIVMRAGRIVESGSVREIFETPREPYTRALLAAGLDPDPQVQAARREGRQQRLASIGAPALAGN